MKKILDFFRLIATKIETELTSSSVISTILLQKLIQFKGIY